MDSIGVTLRTEREKRGLSVEEAHENTKIIVQNISALEEDRFDSFPNKVYARAFLRDYANFLGLDSGELLTEYEDKWSPKAVPDSVPVKKPGSFWRVLGYSVLTLAIAAGLGAGGYFGWERLQRERTIEAESRIADSHTAEPDGATIPKAPRVAPPKPDAPNVPIVAPKPPVAAVAPQTQTLEVTTLRDVWVGVVADGKASPGETVPKGQSRIFQGKTIKLTVGMAGAVQMKLNGQPQPALAGGSLKAIGHRTFTMPPAPASGPGPPATPMPGH